MFLTGLKGPMFRLDGETNCQPVPIIGSCRAITTRIAGLPRRCRQPGRSFNGMRRIPEKISLIH